MSWNQIEGTIAPSLKKAKEKAKYFVEDVYEDDKLAIISPDNQDWWKIKFYDYDGKTNVVVEGDENNE